MDYSFCTAFVRDAHPIVILRNCVVVPTNFRVASKLHIWTLQIWIWTIIWKIDCYMLAVLNEIVKVWKFFPLPPFLEFWQSSTCCFVNEHSGLYRIWTIRKLSMLNGKRTGIILFRKSFTCSLCMAGKPILRTNLIQKWVNASSVEWLVHPEVVRNVLLSNLGKLRKIIFRPGAHHCTEGNKDRCSTFMILVVRFNYQCIMVLLCTFLISLKFFFGM